MVRHILISIILAEFEAYSWQINLMAICVELVGGF